MLYAKRYFGEEFGDLHNFFFFFLENALFLVVCYVRHWPGVVVQ